MSWGGHTQRGGKENGEDGLHVRRWRGSSSTVRWAPARRRTVAAGQCAAAASGWRRMRIRVK